MLMYIDRNTFFPRVRFSKKQEETINEGQICVNCDSLMRNSEICGQCDFSYEKKLPYEKKGDEIEMNVRQSERVKVTEDKKKGIVSLPLMFKGKEKQTCKNCNEINPFFRNNCKLCNMKFAKKRRVQKDQTQSYSLYFWEYLNQLKPLCEIISDLSDYLEESDFDYTQALYDKIKSLLQNKAIQNQIKLYPELADELIESLDIAYKAIITPNELVYTLYRRINYSMMLHISNLPENIELLMTTFYSSIHYKSPVSRITSLDATTDSASTCLILNAKMQAKIYSVPKKKKKKKKNSMKKRRK